MPKFEIEFRKNYIEYLTLTVKRAHENVIRFESEKTLEEDFIHIYKNISTTKLSLLITDINSKIELYCLLKTIIMNSHTDIKDTIKIIIRDLEARKGNISTLNAELTFFQHLEQITSHSLKRLIERKLYLEQTRNALDSSSNIIHNKSLELAQKRLSDIVIELESAKNALCDAKKVLLNSAEEVFMNARITTVTNSKKINTSTISDVLSEDKLSEAKTTLLSGIMKSFNTSKKDSPDTKQKKETLIEIDILQTQTNIPISTQLHEIMPKCPYCCKSNLLPEPIKNPDNEKEIIWFCEDCGVFFEQQIS
jgi:hypothetical protein